MAPNTRIAGPPTDPTWTTRNVRPSTERPAAEPGVEAAPTRTTTEDSAARHAAIRATDRPVLIAGGSPTTHELRLITSPLEAQVSGLAVPPFPLVSKGIDGMRSWREGDA
jgi:hypothetical protein